MIVYLVVSIDTECDKGLDWEVQRPLRFSSVTRGIPERLMPLFERYQITPTFLLSPEVLQDDESIKVLSLLENCELGTHLHGEFIPPFDDPNTERTSTPQFLYSPEIERQKLINLTRLFESRLGYQPMSFRAGRFGISRHTLRVLAELGYLVDSSVTPCWTHSFEGRGEHNFWGAPHQPFFPRWEDASRRGKASVLEVPVTILNPLLVDWPLWLLKGMSRHMRWYKRVLRLLAGIELPKTLWLRPQRSSSREMRLIAEKLLQSAPSAKSIVLNMMYHSVEVMPGASPYAQTLDEVQAILDTQADFFEYLQKRCSVKSIGLSSLLQLFPGNPYAANSQ